jgi:hypothetical protein
MQVPIIIGTPSYLVSGLKSIKVGPPNEECATGWKVVG